jgi:type IV pilus assembly protein PilV
MTTKSKQKGVFLIEALMGILIFSLGILSLVAIQTAAISAQSDAQYRIEAANLANQMLNQIWLGVDRTPSGGSGNPPAGTVVPASLLAFQHHPVPSNGSGCNFSGDASAKQVVTDWASAVTGTATQPGILPLPGATTAMQQILIDTANNNRVTLTLCWKAPLDAGPRKHSVVTYVN